MAPGIIHPVILSGGSGTRLWPVSRSIYPKQLMPLISKASLIEETARRVGDPKRFGAPLVMCNEDHRFLVAEALRTLEQSSRAIVLEPAARNTAPALAVAALILGEEDPDALMLVLASDHHIERKAAFERAIDIAAEAASRDFIVTFGMRPNRPETGYGYIRRGAAIPGLAGAFAVERFVEKPDQPSAESYLASGEYDWNSGMFLFRARRYLSELERLEPEISKAARDSLAKAKADRDFLRLDAEAFTAAPSRSIDYAVMERTPYAAVVPADLGWTDVGSWNALWEIGEKDGAGNVLIGDVLAEGARGNYLRSEARLLAVLGIEDLVVVATDDAVLVVPRARAGEVKLLVERLVTAGRSEPVHHTQVFRPWGSYQSVDTGARFQVKRLIVKPGAKLSLQKHAHRAEHWVVVSGLARVTRGDAVFDLAENESTYIPVGTVHRLENPGTAPLHVIEVQSGGYLGEDDIVRLEDTYGRA